MADETEEKPAIYLRDCDILYWGPQDPTIPIKWNGITQIIKPYGVDIVNATFGSYQVSASAAKYLADIVRVDKDNPRVQYSERISVAPEEKEVLFSGGIEIYQEKEIPESEVKGYVLVCRGKIWCAPKLPVGVLLTDKGLEKIIFGDTNVSSEENIERIEAIINGYEIQERDAAERQHEFELGLVKDGERSGVWKHRHGYSDLSS